MTSEHFEDTYLGLPVPEGCMNKGKYQSLEATLSKKFVDWGGKQPSSGAKETLIKSVVHAILTYIMSVFKLPASTCDHLTRMIRSYWWGMKNGRHKTHWIAWEKMISPKNQGGLGFRDMRMFNQALLARQAWRLLEIPDSLCARLMKAKYY